MAKWIEVKRHLPKTAGRYLVCLNRIAPQHLGGDSRRLVILRWTAEGWRLPVHFPKWLNDEITEYVTHWQPLPAFPPEVKNKSCPHGYWDWDECPDCCH